MFCAICISDIVGEPREFEGAMICVECDEVEVLTATPEHRQRGYDNDGGIGVAFAAQFGAAADRIVPLRVRKLTDDVARGVPPPKSDDWRADDDPRDRFNGLSQNQADYLRDPQSRNRSRR